jgi:disulfide bond formation protein DsbB
MSIVDGQRRLAILWLGGTFLGMLILISETYGNVWGSVAPEAWGWFLPMVVPTLTLIVGSVVAEISKETPSTSKVTPLAFWLTFWVSLAYLVLVILALGMAAFTTKDPPISALKTSSLWLSSLQALVGASIGVFFGGRKPSVAP